MVASSIPHPCVVSKSKPNLLLIPVQWYETDATKVASQLQSFCLASGLVAPARCSSLAAAVSSSSPSGNKGKRAAFICDAIGLCNPDSITATSAGSCVLTATSVSTASAASASTLSSSTLDYCTAEGLPQGSTLPGIAPTASYLPAGTCGEYANH